MKKVDVGIYVNKASYFAQANRFDEEYYLTLTPSQSLSELQFCREQYYKLKK